MSAVFPTPVSPSMTTGTLHLARSWMLSILTTKSGVSTYDESSITERRPLSNGRPMARDNTESSSFLEQSSLRRGEGEGDSHLMRHAPSSERYAAIGASCALIGVLTLQMEYGCQRS